MNSVANSLIEASDRHPSEVERRKARSPFRFWNERRRRNRTDVGMEISDFGISIAYISLNEYDERTLTTDFAPFESLEGEWTVDTIRVPLLGLIEKHRLHGQSVFVAIGGNCCVTRTFSGINDDVDASCRELCERSNHFLALGLGNKIQCKTEQVTDVKRKRAWVTIAQRSVLESIAQALEQTGLRLSGIEHTISILCEIVGHSKLDAQEPLLLVLTGKSSSDLVVSFRGQLVLEYRPSKQGSDTCSVNSWTHAISKHLRCLQRYLSSQLPQGQDQLRKMCIPGSNRSATGATADCLAALNITSVSLPGASVCDGLESKDKIQTSEMMAAIWMSRRTSEAHPIERSGGDLYSIFRPQNRLTVKLLAKSLWPLAASILLLIGLYCQVTHQRFSLSTSERKLESLQPVRLEADRIRSQLVLDGEIHKVSGELKSKLQSPLADHCIRMLGRCLPEGSWLKSAAFEQNGNIVILGMSFTNDAIYDYLANLKQSGLVEDASLTSTRSIRFDSGPAFEFEISAVLAIKRPPAGQVAQKMPALQKM